MDPFRRVRGGIASHLDVHERLFLARPFSDVAELLGHVPPVAGLDRLDELLGLLAQVAQEGRMRLLGVPGTPAGRAEPVHDGDDVEQACARRVPAADEHLDIGRAREAGHLVGDRVGQARVAVRGADPHDVGSARTRDELAGQLTGRP